VLFLVTNDLFGQILALGVRHNLLDVLVFLPDHEGPEPSPNTVVALVLEDWQTGYFPPGKVELRSYLEEGLIHAGSPLPIFGEGGVENVGVALPNLQFALDDHFFANQRPLFAAEVFQQNDHHQALPIVPPAESQLGVQPVVVLVVDVLEGAVLQNLQNFLPVVAILLDDLHDVPFLLEPKGHLGLLFVVEVKPFGVQVYRKKKPVGPGHLLEVDFTRVRGQLRHFKWFFLNEVALASSAVVHPFGRLLGFCGDVVLLGISYLLGIEEGERHVAVKLEEAEEGLRDRKLYFEAHGADVLLDVLHPFGDDVPLS
jgi:hypothetical protein